MATYGLEVEQIGWDTASSRFLGLEDEPIDVLFKLYPWEDVLREEFGARASDPQTAWVEPLWKVVLSNKALLAALWQLYPDHENLLPAYLDDPGSLREWVRKPLHGREGDSIAIKADDLVLTQPGSYGAEGWCFQQYVPMPDFDGSKAVVGSWVVDGKAAGCGIRESNSPITDHYARFVPHYIDGPAPAPAQVEEWRST